MSLGSCHEHHRITPGRPQISSWVIHKTMLIDWGRMTHVCVGKLTIIGLDSGLSSGRRLPIIWTSAGKLLIGPLETNFSEISIGIQTFPFKKMHFKMSSANGVHFVSASMCSSWVQLTWHELDPNSEKSKVCRSWFRHHELSSINLHLAVLLFSYTVSLKFIGWTFCLRLLLD